MLRIIAFGFLLPLAVLVTVLKSAYSLGELSLTAIAMIVGTWLTLFGLTVGMQWPPAVIVVGTVVLAIGCILKTFGGDLRIR